MKGAFTMINRLLNKSEFEELLTGLPDIKIISHRSINSNRFQSYLLQFTCEKLKISATFVISENHGDILFKLNKTPEKMIVHVKNRDGEYFSRSFRSIKDSAEFQNSIVKINKLRGKLKKEITEHVERKAEGQKINLMLREMKVEIR